MPEIKPAVPSAVPTRTCGAGNGSVWSSRDNVTAGYPVRQAARQGGICQHEGGEEQGMSGYDQHM
jgi:hypothetical protein